MMNVKKTIVIFLLILLNNCGYTSIYSNTANNDLKLNIISINGDDDFNNQIKTHAALYSNSDSENEYKVIVNSNYEKIIIAKDSSGIATDYKVIATANFTVKSNGKDENIRFQETIRMVNNSDIFEQNTYEKNLKRNFASSIIKKLIIKILTISDN
ncbi:hypothetical protein N9N83_01620 [Candidatus Pelagibacter sp.]|nr:hypothetical protein [Candidatus Pelagibacter sp.]